MDGKRRNAIALFCAPLRHPFDRLKLRLGEMSVMIFGVPEVSNHPREMSETNKFFDRMLWLARQVPSWLFQNPVWLGFGRSRKMAQKNKVQRQRTEENDNSGNWWLDQTENP
jgi:hypothetical protein